MEEKTLTIGSIFWANTARPSVHTLSLFKVNSDFSGNPVHEVTHQCNEYDPLKAIEFFKEKLFGQGCDVIIADWGTGHLTNPLFEKATGIPVWPLMFTPKGEFMHQDIKDPWLFKGCRKELVAHAMKSLNVSDEKLALDDGSYSGLAEEYSQFMAATIGLGVIEYFRTNGHKYFHDLIARAKEPAVS